jgi:mono/diheme cytochrome c family protein
MEKAFRTKLLSDAEPECFKASAKRAFARSTRLTLICLIFLRGAAEIFSAPAERSIHFVDQVRPVFEQHCYSCHGPERQRSGFRLDVKSEALRGGDLGFAIVPGDGAASPLIRYVSGLDPERVMPPEGERLPDDTVALLRAWIDQGAEWPDGIDQTVLRAKEDHWAFRPAARPAVPEVRNSLWGRTPIDRFILAQLEQEKMSPSPEADRVTLIRRLTFNLTGLVPTPEEVEAFLLDNRPDAYERLVNRLLASPRYGERWARHWLDVVHYGESHGYDKDKPRLHAWPYRDYVIRSFNDDKPYSRFVEEQLAGDVFFPDDPDGIVATGFIAAGPWDFVGHVELPESKMDGLMARYNDRDDMVMTAMSTFQSLTVHCARCHDHKFDPISQEEYYQLQAVFAGVDRANRPFDSDPATAQLRRHLEARQEKLEGKESKSELAELKERLSSLPKQQLVYAAASEFKEEGHFAPAGGIRPVHHLQRGEVTRPLDEVQPGALSCLPDLEASFELPENHPEGHRRAALAKWVTHPENFLTRRSIVNRVWHYHFGRGLVDTPNDFGFMGSRPSHPELLDWLAFWFIENGESFKELHRLILTSSVWRQAVRHNPEYNALDADNRLLWRMNRLRLDAESFRDSVLQISGRIDFTMGGPSIQQFHFKDDHSPVYDYTLYDVDSPGAYRRSIYRFIVRSVPDPFMECLDSADPSLLTPARDVTITALQALATLNNAFVARQAEHFAARLEQLAQDLPVQIELAYQLALSRSPSQEEQELFLEYSSRHGLANACRLLINSNEFMFID